MTPQRLKKSQRLRVSSTYGELRGPRWWIVRHLPSVVIDYLFEILIVVFALLIGVVRVVEWFTTPETSIFAILWGACLLFGSITVGLGLMGGKVGTIVPYGLRLIGGAGIASSAVLLDYYNDRDLLANVRVITLIALVFLVGALAAGRAFILRSTYLLLRWEAQRKDQDGAV